MTLLLSQSIFFIAPEVVAQPKVLFSASKMSQVQVPELNFKEVMRTFYSGQMSRAFLDDDDLEKIEPESFSSAPGFYYFPENKTLAVLTNVKVKCKKSSNTIILNSLNEAITFFKSIPRSSAYRSISKRGYYENDDVLVTPL